MLTCNLLKLSDEKLQQWDEVLEIIVVVIKPLVFFLHIYVYFWCFYNVSQHNGKYLENLELFY